MRYNNTSFPILKLPMSLKDDTWQLACVDYVIGMGEVVSAGMTRTRFEELLTYYNLYNGIFDEKDLKLVTNPFKVDDGFPATPHDFNIIRPKVDLLIGEETKRPFNFRVVRTNPDAASDMQEQTKKMVLDYIMASIKGRMSDLDALDFLKKLESGEVMPPDLIARYMLRDYKDIVENCAYHTLSYLKLKLNINHEYIKGWKDALIAGLEVYYVGIRNDEPYLERVNPLYFSFDKSPDLEFIEDGDWCCRRMRKSYTEVYDNYFDKMKEKLLNELLDLINQSPKQYGMDKNMLDDFNHIRMRIVDTPSNDFTSRNSVNVWHACWKSFKMIYYVIYKDENGDTLKTIVDENYTKNGTEESIEKDWIIEVWEGYRAGSDLYFGILPIQYQHVSIDNPNSLKLPYCGVLYSNTNSVPKSLVSILKPLLYMYIILWYRLELALARDKGKILTMDITLIPKSMGIDPARWLHYLSSVGVNFINPYEEGWDTPGRDGGHPASFNLIGTQDTTMSNVIAQYIQLMSKIEELTSTLSGVSLQRLGEISSSELVGNVERSVVLSSHITEPLYWMHNQCKRNTLNMLLNTAKAAWADSGKKKLSYIYDDAERAFLDICPEFYYEDMDVFVTDSSKDSENIEALKTLIQPAMLNGATLLEAAEILTTDNLSSIKSKLKEIMENQLLAQKQLALLEQELQQLLQQMLNDAKEQELMLKEAEMDIERYKIDQDNLTKLTVAELGTYKGLLDMDLNSNGTPDPMEIVKDATLKMKIELDQYTKKYDIDVKKAIELSKINLEKEKMSHETKLQEEKDDAAMLREKLKSETALKNKVVGQSKPLSL